MRWFFNSIDYHVAWLLIVTTPGLVLIAAWTVVPAVWVMAFLFLFPQGVILMHMADRCLLGRRSTYFLANELLVALLTLVSMVLVIQK